jgi:hypothetical protein
MELTKHEIVESNKLIAEFMGFRYIPFSETDRSIIPGWHKSGTEGGVRDLPPFHRKTTDGYLCRRHRDLRYYNSWDWLMPVVEKIESLDLGELSLEFKLEGRSSYLCVFDFIQAKNYKGAISLELDSDKYKGERIADPSTWRCKLNNAYLTVVKFIKWYNKKKTKKNKLNGNCTKEKV